MIEFRSDQWKKLSSYQESENLIILLGLCFRMTTLPLVKQLHFAGQG